MPDGPYIINPDCSCDSDVVQYTPAEQSFFDFLYQYGIGWNERIRDSFVRLLRGENPNQYTQNYYVAVGDNAPQLTNGLQPNIFFENGNTFVMPELIGFDISVCIDGDCFAPQESDVPGNYFVWNPDTGTLFFPYTEVQDNIIAITAINSSNIPPVIQDGTEFRYKIGTPDASILLPAANYTRTYTNGTTFTIPEIYGKRIRVDVNNQRVEENELGYSRVDTSITFLYELSDSNLNILLVGNYDGPPAPTTGDFSTAFSSAFNV